MLSGFDGNQFTSQVNDLLNTPPSTDESEHSSDESENHSDNFIINDEYIDDDLNDMSHNIRLNQSDQVNINVDFSESLLP